MAAKDALLGVARICGAFTAFRAINRRRILVLTYHRFSRSSEPGRTSAAAFASHLDCLAAHYNVLPLSTVARAVREHQRLPPSTAAITIDDGFADFYEVAYPILRQRRMPATVFAVTDFVDGKQWIWTDRLRFLLGRVRADRIALNVLGSRIVTELTDDASRRQLASRINTLLKRQPDEVKDEQIQLVAAQCAVTMPAAPPADYGPCTWEQLREMESSGIEVGSHTVTHPILTRVPSDRLRLELEGSRRRLEEMLGHPVAVFCYPNGSYDRAVRDAVERAGYRLAVTSDSGLNDVSVDPLLFRRVQNEGEDLTHFLQSTSGFEEAKSALRAKLVSSPG